VAVAHVLLAVARGLRRQRGAGRGEIMPAFILRTGARLAGVVGAGAVGRGEAFDTAPHPVTHGTAHRARAARGCGLVDRHAGIADVLGARVPVVDRSAGRAAGAAGRRTAGSAARPTRARRAAPVTAE